MFKKKPQQAYISIENVFAFWVLSDLGNIWHLYNIFFVPTYGVLHLKFLQIISHLQPVSLWAILDFTETNRQLIDKAILNDVAYPGK